MPALWEDYRNNFDKKIPNMLFGKESAEDVKKAHKIVEHYVGSIDNINEEHMQGMVDMFTDSLFLHGTYKTIGYLLKM